MGQPSNSSPLPEWALEHARASLRIGHSVPDIEQRLIARGLAPVVAHAVTDCVLDEWMGAQAEPIGEGESGALVHRVLSAVLGAVCLALAYWFGGGLSVGRTVIWLLLPLACIWFPEIMGRSANANLAAGLRMFGWLLLLLICGYRGVLLLIAV